MNVVGVLKIDEGLSLVPYIDSEGYPTVGNGIRIGPKKASLDMYQFERFVEKMVMSILEKFLSLFLM